LPGVNTNSHFTDKTPRASLSLGLSLLSTCSDRGQLNAPDMRTAGAQTRRDYRGLYNSIVTFRLTSISHRAQPALMRFRLGHFHICCNSALLSTAAFISGLMSRVIGTLGYFRAQVADIF